jgi:hypothetical protein
MAGRMPKPKSREMIARSKVAQSSSLKGSSQALIMGVLLTLFISAGSYLYSVNRNATQGYHLRTLEKEIAKLSENTELKISEADMRSFYRINSSKDELQMEKTESLKYLEAKDTVALR